MTSAFDRWLTTDPRDRDDTGETCDRCGESLMTFQNRAEVVGDVKTPDGRFFDPLIIHADCIKDEDVIA